MEAHRNGYNKWLKGENKKPCSCFSYFQKYGIENFKIVLIKSYEVCRVHNKDSWHLRAYETLWINKTKCVNINSPIDYLKKEKKREYYEKHKEERNAKGREWYQKNKEEQNAKAREYHHKHKEERNAKRREYYEKHKEEHSAKNREWREKNKEELKVKKREWNEKNKQEISAKRSVKIECEFCGCMSSKRNIARHQKSQKCLEAQSK